MKQAQAQSDLWVCDTDCLPMEKCQRIYNHFLKLPKSTLLQQIIPILSTCEIYSPLSKIHPHPISHLVLTSGSG